MCLDSICILPFLFERGSNMSSLTEPIKVQWQQLLFIRNIRSYEKENKTSNRFYLYGLQYKQFDQTLYIKYFENYLGCISWIFAAKYR